MTVRPTFFVVAFVVTLVAIVVAALVTGPAALLALPIAVFYGMGARRALFIDDRRLRYRGLWPAQDVTVPWADVTQVALDLVHTGTPGSPGKTITRMRIAQGAGVSHELRLFDEADGDPVAERCRRLGVPLVDQRGER